MDIWERLADRDEYKDLTFLKGPVPVNDSEIRIKMLEKCKENLCGCYNTNWGCPPGADADPADLYKKTSFVLIAKRVFVLNVNDKALTEKASNEMQDISRSFLMDLRKEGMRCTAFTDGPCTYCGQCAYPDPCRFPEMKIMSVSTLGIDVGKYLKTLNEEFSFSQDRMTLYSFFFTE